MENEKTESIKQENLRLISAYANSERVIPKFCTRINMGLLNTKNLIMTLVYDEGVAGNDGVVIERIAIDFEHAKSLNKALSEIIRNAENVKLPN